MEMTDGGEGPVVNKEDVVAGNHKNLKTQSQNLRKEELESGMQRTPAT
jgi:hypothetical protein